MTTPRVTVPVEPTAVDKLETVYDWLREPDYGDTFNNKDLIEWLNRRPSGLLMHAIGEVKKRLSAAPAPESGASDLSDDAICKAAETIRASSVAWANDPSEFSHLIELTPAEIRNLITALATRSDGRPEGGAVLQAFADEVARIAVTEDTSGDDAFNALNVVVDYARELSKARPAPDDTSGDLHGHLFRNPALATREEAPAGSAHTCYDEHQPGCDCVIPAQKAVPVPSFLERMTAPAEAGELDRAIKRMRNQLVGSATFTQLMFGREDVRIVLDTLVALRAQPPAREDAQPCPYDVEHKLAEVEGFGASYSREQGSWRLYSMPDAKPFGSIDGFDRASIDFVIDALRSHLRAQDAQPVAGLRPVVLAFAHLMEAKLKENDWKGGWERDNPAVLLSRLREETDELAEAVAGPGADNISWKALTANEAADVANFAMMVADVCGGLPDSAVRSIAESTTHPAPDALRVAVEALEAAGRAISAQYALAQAEYQHLDHLATKHDKIVQEGRLAIREALAALQAEQKGGAA